MMTVFLAACAAAAAFWPTIAAALPAGGGVRLPRMPAPRAHAGYAGAIAALSAVRGRLLATEGLADKERAAIDTLTLALVNGSDRE
jgi:hypothetical protein